MRRYLDQQLKLRQIRAISAIATHGSLLRASKVLSISQPALTKTLHEAEELVGGRLFERHARGVQPTPFGYAVIETCRRILAELRRLDEELDRIASQSGGTIALGALPVAAAGILPGTLALLKQQHPSITLKLVQGTTEDLLPALAVGDIDLIIGRLYEPLAPDGLIREWFYNEPISIVARAEHPIFSSQEPPLESLQRYELILPTISQRIGQEIEHMLAMLELPPAVALRSSSSTFIREMLYSTDMLSLMPALMVVGDLMRGTIRMVQLPEELIGHKRPAGVIRRKDKELPASAAVLLNCLRLHLAEMNVRELSDITGIDTRNPTDDKTPAQA